MKTFEIIKTDCADCNSETEQLSEHSDYSFATTCLICGRMETGDNIPSGDPIINLERAKKLVINKNLKLKN